jgi:hypothetical protein
VITVTKAGSRQSVACGDDQHTHSVLLFSSLEVVTAYEILASAAYAMEADQRMLLPTFSFSISLSAATMGRRKDEFTNISVYLVWVRAGSWHIPVHTLILS